MSNLAEKQVSKWEKSRNVGRAIVNGISNRKAVGAGQRATVESRPILRARERSALSQSQFAALLGVSVRTLQEWEQGRREPSAAAKTLIKIAELNPGILRNIAA